MKNKFKRFCVYWHGSFSEYVNTWKETKKFKGVFDYKSSFDTFDEAMNFIKSRVYNNTMYSINDGYGPNNTIWAGTPKGDIHPKFK